MMQNRAPITLRQLWPLVIVLLCLCLIASCGGNDDDDDGAAIPQSTGSRPANPADLEVANSEVLDELGVSVLPELPQEVEDRVPRYLGATLNQSLTTRDESGVAYLVQWETQDGPSEVVNFYREETDARPSGHCQSVGDADAAAEGDLDMLVLCNDDFEVAITVVGDEEGGSRIEIVYFEPS